MSRYSRKVLLCLMATMILNVFTLNNKVEMATNNYTSIVKKAQNEYKSNNYQYHPYIQHYEANNDYLNASKKIYQLSRIAFDESGIPMVKYYDKYEYNPVTIAQMALSEYGKYIKTKNENYKQTFLKYTDGLIKLQDSQGAFRYNFRYESKHLRVVYSPGWVSAMAQGQALSVFTRAYFLTKDEKYLLFGQKAFEFLMTPKPKGGVFTNLGDISRKYKNHLFFEEYVTNINNYTLNGYMFTLLGIYDWSKLTVAGDYKQKEAEKVFIEGIKSLKIVLPMYDLNGFTSYDLSHITMKQKPHVVIKYHAVHIYLLHALYTITNDPELRHYSRKWKSYVD